MRGLNGYLLLMKSFVTIMKKHFLLPSILILVAFFSVPSQGFAHGDPPPTLRGVKIPKTPGLVGGSKAIVVNQKYARILGKSLFWDESLGSDGMACASCHFHAGADFRADNQLSPGFLHAGSSTRTTFEPTASGAAGGPNHELRLNDFPFYQHQDPDDKTSPITFLTDDVLGSAGSFKGQFQAFTADLNDQCGETDDAIFHLHGKNTRQVTDRNAPSVINAALNYRQFWDGRANNLFNGENEWGARDPQAGVWVAKSGGMAIKTRLLLANASLASQAVAPPNNAVEMACAERKFPELARKLLNRSPLMKQEVHAQDSVLAKLRSPAGKGLNTTYEALIKKAFARRFWSGKGDFGTAKDGSAYTQMEANFPFFLGLALQMYESTLISDKAPYDTRAGKDKIPKGLDEQQRRGLNVFLEGHCHNCHGGPAFTLAAYPEISFEANKNGPTLVDRTVIDSSSQGAGLITGLFDQGFANTSVVPTEYDLGVGGTDPFGNPLSFTRQYVNALLDGRVDLVDPIKVYACDLASPFIFDYPLDQLVDDPNGLQKGKCSGYKDYAKVPSASAFAAQLQAPNMGNAFHAVDGAFKIPSLRNIELTGPYMHNGGMKSLEEVVDFYSRGGNLTNPQHSGMLVFKQGFTEQNKADLIAFLKSLTDPRVAHETAPFDHPGLDIPYGHEPGASPIRANLSKDHILSIPAVGKHGRSPELGPIKSFESQLTD